MTRPVLPGLFEVTVEALPRFDGATFDPELDTERLTGQLQRVFTVMRDGRWRILAELHQATGDPEASLSARLRDLRKPRYGSWRLERRRRGVAERGLFEYRLTRRG